MIRSILKNPEEVELWFQDCPEVLSFDFETTGLNYLKMEPVGLSLCDGERSCYIPIWENKQYVLFKDTLRNNLRIRTLIAHNLKFDYKCTKKFLEIELDSCFCTFIAAYLLDENRSSHSLDSLAEEYLGANKTGTWDSFSNWNSEEFYEYAIVDAELCYQLYELFEPRLRAEKLEHVFYQIEMPFIPVAAELEINGVLVDQEALADLQLLVEQRIEECENELLKQLKLEPTIETGLYGQKFRSLPVNFNSPDQLVGCFNKLGLPIKDKTPGGKPSVAKSTLDSLQGNPFVDTLIEYKRLRKLYTSYILPCWEMIDEDGRIRPSVGIVKTGRTSMSNPNLQQLPNVKDREINYRRIFTSSGRLIGADYAGQELRILGEVTQDERIRTAFNSGHDLHLTTANYIFDLHISDDNLRMGGPRYEEICKQYKSERYKAKNGANFPIVYGTSAAGISFRQGVSKDEAQRWIDGFFKAYPRVKSCMSEIPNRLYKDGHVSTLMGRKRRFGDYQTLPQFSRGKFPSKDRCVRQAFNFLIQGFAADQAKIAGRKIYDAFRINPQWEARIVMLVHDEWVTECKEEYAEQVKACMIDCMKNAVCLSVPFEVDCKIGTCYSEIK